MRRMFPVLVLSGRCSRKQTVIGSLRQGPLVEVSRSRLLKGKRGEEYEQDHDRAPSWGDCAVSSRMRLHDECCFGPNRQGNRIPRHGAHCRSHCWQVRGEERRWRNQIYVRGERRDEISGNWPRFAKGSSEGRQGYGAVSRARFTISRDQCDQAVAAIGVMEINTHTQFCGVIGNPVEHSLSPAIHNAAFQKLGLNFVYLAFRVDAIGDAIKGLRALGGFRGASVTIPHKVSVVHFLDDIESMAQQIGAVNTILAIDGKLIGYNTDATGALRALREGGAPLKNETVAMLGSGGAARAIAFALAVESGISCLILLGIEEKERTALAADLRTKTTMNVVDSYLDEAALKAVLPHARVLIHCTPIGMAPKVGKSCVPAVLLHRRLTVMDIVYNPRNTQLLLDARAAGCCTIPGLEMFLHQATAQFELWTNKAAPTDVMRAVLESQFS